MNSTTILDFFDSAEEFDDTLADAEAAASTSREIDFVDDLRNKFDEYGERMFLSNAQYEWLLKIAGQG